MKIHPVCGKCSCKLARENSDVWFQPFCNNCSSIVGNIQSIEVTDDGSSVEVRYSIDPRAIEALNKNRTLREKLRKLMSFRHAHEIYRSAICDAMTVLEEHDFTAESNAVMANLDNQIKLVKADIAVNLAKDIKSLSLEGCLTGLEYAKDIVGEFGLK